MSAQQQSKVKNKYKLWQLVMIERDGYNQHGEIVSMETDDHQYFVRLVPNDPTTAVYVPASKVAQSPLLKRRKAYVHKAIVSGPGSFPIDMLRRECAAPVNFELDIDDHPIKIKGTDLIIYTISHLSSTERAWRPERWRSFNWVIRPIETTNITLRQGVVVNGFSRQE